MTDHVAEISSQTPLMSLAAVVADTETTGLDTKTARIIQIGAVRLAKGAISDDTYDLLVNPQQPISAESTKIHGIADADVAEAAAIDEALPDFGAWCGGAVLIGYSIGFDLAILKAEHRRVGTAWQAPRSLDVRHLVQLLGPQLPDQALDTVASWLGLTIDGRHQALADARATAEIFLALVPKLRQRGILTLAQAESACRELADQRSSEAQAGWHEVVGHGGGGPAFVGALARVDSYPYRHRVRDIMHSPATIVPGGNSLRDVLALLMREKVSSVFVSPVEPKGRHGIITERDILRLMDNDPGGALGQSAGDVAVRPLVSIAADEFIYRAIARMTSGRYRHLAVHDHDGAIVGAVSARDLLRQRASDAISLGDEIDAASGPEELGIVWSKLTMVARGLSYEEVDPRDIAAIVSRELRALTRRACEIAEAEMAARGEGAPPVPYAMLVLGSGGRGESLLAMDQDNAIVFESETPGDGVDAWFESLGKRVSDILDAVGVQYCKGGIMAANKPWRMSVADWREAIAGWIGRSSPEDILNTDIFFDSKPVHGDLAMGAMIREEALDLAAGSRQFLHLLARNAADVKSPVGWFGRFRLTDGRMDLKMGGIMPVFSAARVLALQRGLTVHSTPERLEALRGEDDISEVTVNNLIDAHRVLLGAILTQQLRDLEAGVALSNSVAPKLLSGLERDEIKWALSCVEAVPGLLGVPVIG